MFQRLALAACLCALVCVQPIGAFADPAGPDAASVAAGPPANAPTQPGAVSRNLEIFAVCLDQTGDATPNHVVRGVKIGLFPQVSGTTVMSDLGKRGYRLVAMISAAAISTGVSAPPQCIGAVVAMEAP